MEELKKIVYKSNQKGNPQVLEAHGTAHKEQGSTSYYRNQTTPSRHTFSSWRKKKYMLHSYRD